MPPALIAAVCVAFTVLGLAFVVERICYIIAGWRKDREEKLRWK